MTFSDEPDTDHTPAILDELAKRVIEQDRRLRPTEPANRAQHMKLILGAFGVVRINGNIPAAAKHGPFAEDRTFQAVVRFSNGQPVDFDDHFPDVRGIAVRFFPSGVETDLLCTNEQGRSHARTAEQFVAVADILADADMVLDLNKRSQEGIDRIFKDLWNSKIDLPDALNITNILSRTVVPVHSLARETYWGSVVKLGDAPIKYSLAPLSPAAGSASGRDYLRADLENRLQAGSLRFSLRVQFYENDHDTSVTDASKVWNVDPIEIGEVEVVEKAAGDDEKFIDRIAFNPGNGFDPLGITHARKAVYAASAAHRQANTGEQARQFIINRRGSL